MTKYTARKQVNAKSRNQAVHDRELWSEDEVEVLMQFWGEVPLEEIAATVGRTLEACRQKHYEIQKRPERVVAEREIQQVNTWSGGFTSLADMGY